jgi:LacI family transcriptional regulator
VRPKRDLDHECRARRGVSSHGAACCGNVFARRACCLEPFHATQALPREPVGVLTSSLEQRVPRSGLRGSDASGARVIARQTMVSEDELGCSRTERRAVLADDKPCEVLERRRTQTADEAAIAHHRALEARMPRVLVALDSSATWSRGILRGFAGVAHEQGWTLLHYHPDANLESLAAELHPSAAVLGPTFHGPWPERLRGCVSVAINEDREKEGIASVLVDEERIAELAASHFVTRGFHNVSTLRFEAWAAGRERRFREAAARLGARLEPGWGPDALESLASDERPTAIIAWLNALPKPCGIFTCCDAWGRMLAHYAYVARLRVPEDVALLGVDNDVFECEITAPPLSTVAVPWRSVGEHAARLVQRGLLGANIAGTREIIAPVDVVVRRSSDTFAIQDPLVAAAVAWIREHIAMSLTVPTVAGALRSTRQRLERHFRRHLGRTIAEEIRRSRVEVARRLLLTSELSLSEISKRCGFTSPALLSVAFRREVGVPPGAYRRHARGLDETEE